MTKACTACRIEKPIADFWPDRSKKHGRAARCKDCNRDAARRWRAENPEAEKKRYWSNPRGERERHLRRKYGVDLAGYQVMLEAQGGGCAVCGRKQERALDVDHCHATGIVRGLLCTNCNRMIGHSADNAEILRRAAEYLDSSRNSRRSSSGAPKKRGGR